MGLVRRTNEPKNAREAKTTIAPAHFIQVYWLQEKSDDDRDVEHEDAQYEDDDNRNSDKHHEHDNHKHE